MRDLEVKGRYRLYAVYREGGERVSTFYTLKEQALNRMDALLKAERTTDRKCMCCRSTFRSEGNHNRLCNICRTKDFDPMMLQASAVAI